MPALQAENWVAFMFIRLLMLLIEFLALCKVYGIRQTPD